MFEASFAQLFRAVERVRLQLQTADDGLRPYLAQELLCLQAFGEQVIDQWMTLDEHIQDLFETYDLGAALSSDSSPAVSQLVFDPPQTRAPYPTQASAPSSHLEPSPDFANPPDAWVSSGLMQAVFDWPDQTAAQFRRGLAYFDLLMLDEAKQALTAALEHSDALIIRLFLAAVLAARGEGDEARKHLRFVRVGETDPTITAAVWEIEAQVFLQEERYREAAERFAAITSHLPDHADAWFNLALARILTGRLDDAAAALSALLRRQPADREGWVLFTQVYVRQGAMEQALAVCEAGLNRFPADPDLLLWKSKLAHAAGAVEQSEQIARALADQYPFDAAAVTWCAWLLLARRSHAEATALLKRLLSVSRNHPLALMELGVTHLLAGELEAAERILRVCVRVHTDTALAWLALSALHLARRDASAALRSSRRASRDPRRAVRRLALYQSARALLELSRMAEAESLLRAAHLLGPPDAGILEALADCAEHLGRPEEAVRRRAQARHLQDSGAREDRPPTEAGVNDGEGEPLSHPPRVLLE
ncbi:MAG: tetratricopeptide repeat protein [Alicyclobacillus sp.]|nr:tetratricopeptide repeat protein [Alicyclobacillus sp.]